MRYAWRSPGPISLVGFSDALAPKVRIIEKEAPIEKIVEALKQVVEQVASKRVVVPIIKEVPIEVVREVPVERIIEKEIPVEKIVEKIVEVSRFYYL
jgi:hypothetical protein